LGTTQHEAVSDCGQFGPAPLDEPAPATDERTGVVSAFVGPVAFDQVVQVLDARRSRLAVALAVAAVLAKESMALLLVAHAVTRRTRESVLAAFRRGERGHVVGGPPPPHRQRRRAGQGARARHLLVGSGTVRRVG
jgi:hypothetical protein